MFSRGAFTTYKNLGQFESFLEEHLRKVVVQRLPSGALRSIRVKATWTGESPFRGLSAFDVEHERIFFGRTAAIETKCLPGSETRPWPGS